jgi:formylmethanofuran dehydrogenase subunit E
VCTEKTLWEKAVEFHGHVCPGLAMGYRAACEAMERLAQERAEDDQIVAMVETDACGVDAIQVITGCTFGKGNLIFRDLGKQVFLFGVRGKDEGLRVAMKYGALKKFEPEGWSELRKKYFNGKTDEEEKKRFRTLHEQLAEKILTVPLEEIMETKRVTIELPPKAKIYETRQCFFCGEGVMEPRVRVREGKFACLECAIMVKRSK